MMPQDEERSRRGDPKESLKGEAWSRFTDAFRRVVRAPKDEVDRAIKEERRDRK